MNKQSLVNNNTKAELAELVLMYKRNYEIMQQTVEQQVINFRNILGNIDFANDTYNTIKEIEKLQ